LVLALTITAFTGCTQAGARPAVSFDTSKNISVISRELEAAGYITRRQTRDGKGKMSNIEYTIYEQPQKPDAPELDKPPFSPSCDFPITDKPITENPLSDSPTSENATQLNKEKALSSKEKIITDSSSTHQSIYPATREQEPPPDGEIDRIDRRNATEIYRDIIKDNIEYDALCMDYDTERVTEILELILETVCTSRKTIHIGGEDFPAEVVKSRFMKLGQFHVEYTGHLTASFAISFHLPFIFIVSINNKFRAWPGKQ